MAHDRPFAPRRSHILEPGRLENGRRPHVGIKPRARLDRIALDHHRSHLSRILDGTPQKRGRHTLSPHGTVDDEADDRPHRMIVDAGKSLESIEGGVRLARRDRTPTYRFAFDVREDSNRIAGSRPTIKLGDSTLLS